MIHITRQLDGERLRRWQYEGFVDETVLVVPMGGELFEVAVRVIDRPCHTQPTDAPRAATLDEVAEVAALLARKAEI
jgi:hypothetical protein